MPGDILLLDDGRVQLKVLEVQGMKVFTEVTVGGPLSNNKGINKLGGGLSAEALTDKDKADIVTAAKIGVDYLAVSFPRCGEDLNYARRLVLLLLLFFSGFPGVPDVSSSVSSSSLIRPLATASSDFVEASSVFRLPKCI